MTLADSGAQHTRPGGIGHGNRRLHPDRQQWLADLDDLAAVYADVRTQSADRPARRALRHGLRALDDQAARLRRQERVLGPQPGVLHADGRTRRRHREDPPLRLGRGADHSAGNRRAHGLDDRFHLRRPLRGQHRLRLGEGGVRADGPVAGPGAFRQTLRLQHRICPRDAGALGDGPFRLQGRVLPDGRLQAQPQAVAAGEDRRRRPERPRHGLRRRIWRLQLLPGRRREHAERLRAAYQAADGGGGQDGPRSCSW